ncbi:UNVERIFIED_CONTAM: hypothetical protein RKD50_000254 [Streptomyces canus]
MVPYPSLLDVPYELVEHVSSWLVYTRGHELRSPWRKLSCFKQALLTLAHLRKHETLAQVGAGFGVSEATAWRYVDEMLEVLAAWASVACTRPWSGWARGTSSSSTGRSSRASSKRA